MLANRLIGLSRGGGGDPYFSSVVALLHFNGADASTTFTDVIGKTWTPSGDAQIDTSQSKFGGASGQFDGTGDYLSTASNADFGFGTGDYTLECFARGSNTSGVVGNIFDTRTGGNTGVAFFMGGGNYGVTADSIGCSSNTGILAQAPGVSANTWHHIALSRSGTTLRGFIDGVEKFSATDSRTYASASTCFIGADYAGTANQRFPGWIDEVRITKGVARYTGNFTPPTAPFPDS